MNAYDIGIIVMICAVIIIVPFPYPASERPVNSSNTYQLDVTALTENGTDESLPENTTIIIFYGANFSQSTRTYVDTTGLGSLVSIEHFTIGETVRIVFIEGSILYHPYTAKEYYQYTVQGREVNHAFNIYGVDLGRSSFGSAAEYRPVTVAKWNSQLVTEPTLFP